MNDKISESSAKPTVEDVTWVKSVLKDHLDDQADRLDFIVSSKLSAARHRALVQDQHPSKGFFTGAWMSNPELLGGASLVAIGTVVAAVLLSNSTTFQPTEVTAQSTKASFIEELELLSASDDLEFFQSVEFLEWMAVNSG